MAINPRLAQLVGDHDSRLIKCGGFRTSPLPLGPRLILKKKKKKTQQDREDSQSLFSNNPNSQGVGFTKEIVKRLKNFGCTLTGKKKCIY